MKGEETGGLLTETIKCDLGTNRGGVSAIYLPAACLCSLG